MINIIQYLPTDCELPIDKQKLAFTFYIFLYLHFHNILCLNTLYYLRAKENSFKNSGLLNQRGSIINKILEDIFQKIIWWTGDPGGFSDYNFF